MNTEQLYRRTLRVLLVSQVLAGAGLAAGVTVGALLAEDMVGSTGSAGLPAALLTLGSAAAAAGVGRLLPALRPPTGPDARIRGRRTRGSRRRPRGRDRQRAAALRLAPALRLRDCDQP